MDSQNKQQFKSYCDRHGEQMPLFLKYEWYKSIYPANQWDVSLAYNGEQLLGVMPYFKQSKKTLKKIIPPPLTPYQGPWLSFEKGIKLPKRHSLQHQLMDQLIEGLPSYHQFVQHFYPDFENWLPFYWKGFRQSTRFTYILKDIRAHEEIFSNFKESLRRAIKKANKHLEVIQSEDIKTMITLKKKAYRHKGKSFQIADEIIERIHDYVRKNNCGTLLEAQNSSGQSTGMLLVVWDNSYAYYLLGAVDPEFKNSGALSLLLWEGIKLASQHVHQFNFEGSMIPSIERYFRSFGGEMMPYMRIEHYKGWKGKLLDLIV